MARAQARDAGLGAHVRRHRQLRGLERRHAVHGVDALAENRAGDSLLPRARAGVERSGGRAPGGGMVRARVRDHRLRVPRLEVSARRLRRRAWSACGAGHRRAGLRRARRHREARHRYGGVHGAAAQEQRAGRRGWRKKCAQEPGALRWRVGRSP